MLCQNQLGLCDQLTKQERKEDIKQKIRKKMVLFDLFYKNRGSFHKTELTLIIKQINTYPCLLNLTNTVLKIVLSLWEAPGGKC